MANKKITELNAATSLAATDVVPVVDVSADETKKITATDLFRTLPDGTAAAPALSFASDAGNGVFLAGTDTVGISTGGTQRVTVDGSGNVTISGDLTVSGATTTVESTTVTIDDKNIELGSVASPSNTTADGGGITLKGATDKTIKWVNSTGYWTFNTGIEVEGYVQVDDNYGLRIGTGQDLKIFHDGTNNYIKADNGNIIIKNATSDFFEGVASTGVVNVKHNGTTKLATRSDGVNVIGELECDSLDVDGNIDIHATRISYSTSNEAFKFLDGIKSVYGNGDDLQIHHDGTHSRINDNGSGSLLLQSNGTSIQLNKGTAENMLVANTDGAVDIYYDGSKKFATKSDGVDVTGELQCDSLDVDGAADITGTVSLHGTLDLQDDDRIKLGTGDDLQIYHTGSNSYIADTGTGNLFIRANSQLVLESNNGENYLAANENGDVHLYYDGGVRISTKSDGANVVGELECDSLDVDGGIDIDGGKIFYDASADNLHFGDNVQLRIGTSSDLQIYHDGSASYIADNGTGNLNIQTNGGGVVLTKGSSENLAKFIVDGAVELYHDNAKKFETLSTGASVTGNLGIGTTSAGSKLQIVDTMQATANQHNQLSIIGDDSGTDGESARIFLSAINATNRGCGIVSERQSSSNDHNLIFQTSPVSNIPAERMRIGGDGKVYFGDFSSAAAAGYIDKATSGSYELDIVASRSTTTNRDIRFFSRSNQEAMRIDSSGRLLLNNPFSAYTAGSQTDFALYSEANNYYGLHVGGSFDLNINAGGSVSSGKGEIRFHTAASEAMRLDSSGRLLLGTTTEGSAEADTFTIAESGSAGMTIRTGTSARGSIFFSDGTSGAAEYDGQIQYDQSGRWMRFATAQTERFRITSTGAWAIEGGSNYGTSGQVLTSNGNDAPTWQDAGAASVGGASAISMNDGVKVNFGAGNDLQIYHDGSNSRIDNSVGSLIIKNTADDQDVILSTDNGSGGTTTYVRCDGSTGQVDLTHLGTTKLNTKSDGVDITGELQCDTLDVDGNADISGNIVLNGDLDLQDSNSIKLGTGDDFHLIHNGSNTHLENYTGGYFLDQNVNDGYIALRSDNGSGGLTNYVYCDGSSGVVNLGYYGTTKLNTKSDGIDVSGEVQCDSLDVDGGGDFTGGVNFRGGTGAVDVKAGSDIRLESGGWTGDSAGKIQHHGDWLYVQGGSNGIIFRHSNGSNRVRIDSSGHLRPDANNTYDLGRSDYRWRNVYTNDLNLSNEGHSNDVDGTWGSYTIQEGEDDLFLINRRNGKKYKFNLTEVS